MSEHTPPRYERPVRLTVVPEALIRIAAVNVSPLVDHDRERIEEVIRRVLAPLLLAEENMPMAPSDRYPDGTPTPRSAPMGAASGYRCQWGLLRPNGDVVMCALEEDQPDGQPGPGHDPDAPGKHGWRDGSYGHVPFRESEPRAFYAPGWLGEGREYDDLVARLETP